MDCVPVVDAVSHGNRYKPDAEISDFRAATIVSLFTDRIRIRDGNFKYYWRLTTTTRLVKKELKTPKCTWSVSNHSKWAALSISLHSGAQTDILKNTDGDIFPILINFHKDENQQLI